MVTLTQAQLYMLINLFFWPFVRILSFVMVDPLLSIRAVPRRVKVGFALALTVVVVPLLNTVPSTLPSGPAAIMLLIQQIMIGASIGFVVRLMFTAVEMAGDLAGLQMGLGFAAQIDPVHGGQTPVLAQLMGVMATLIFFALDGHLMVIRTVLDSFQQLPVAPVPVSSKGFYALVEFAGKLFTLGLWLSLPVVVTLLLTNVAIGVIARAAPQMNLFAVGFPLTLLLGTGALYISLPTLVPALANWIGEMTNFLTILMKTFVG